MQSVCRTTFTLAHKLFHFEVIFDRRNDLSPFGERVGIEAVRAGIVLLKGDGMSVGGDLWLRGAPRQCLLEGPSARSGSGVILFAFQHKTYSHNTLCICCIIPLRIAVKKQILLLFCCLYVFL